MEAIAVNLLFSHLNPAHERRVEEIIEEEYPEMYVAALVTRAAYRRRGRPLEHHDVQRLCRAEDHRIRQGISALLAGEGFAGALVFMQSNGGVATGAVVMREPGRPARLRSGRRPCAGR